MTQMMIVLNLDRCLGCHACTVACKQENSVAPGIFRTRVLQMGPTGKFPDLKMYSLPLSCQHCKDPECVKVCPTGASSKREDGIVLIDQDKCIGCQYCKMACPYGVRYFNEQKGVMEKCDLCAHLVDKGDIPACVKTCVGKARIFGDIEDPNSEVSKIIREADGNVHNLVDVGNRPSLRFVLGPRIGTWRS